MTEKQICPVCFERVNELGTFDRVTFFCIDCMRKLPMKPGKLTEEAIDLAWEKNSNANG